MQHAMYLRTHKVTSWAGAWGCAQHELLLSAMPPAADDFECVQGGFEGQSIAGMQVGCWHSFRLGSEQGVLMRSTHEPAGCCTLCSGHCCQQPASTCWLQAQRPRHFIQSETIQVKPICMYQMLAQPVEQSSVCFSSAMGSCEDGVYH